MSLQWDWNVFRYLGDICHTFSKCILIWQIHSNHSAEGVSLITQTFYLIVFSTRYLPFPVSLGVDPSGIHIIWNITLKIFYILSSIYILLLMLRVYARTRERENSFKLAGAILALSLILSPLTMMTFRKRAEGRWTAAENSWVFSIILESICVLPQLLLLRQTTVPTVIDSFYLVTLGSYRFFYILNWIVRGAQKRGVDPISVIFGVIETLIFFDFFWVYWSRQRVKLRGGVVVDSDDLSKGWLVKRLLAHRQFRSSGGEDEGDEEWHGGQEEVRGTGDSPNGHAAGSAKRKGWGSKGISVSADDGVFDGPFDDERGRDGDELPAPKNFSDDVDEPVAKNVPDRNEIAVREDSSSVPLVGDGSEWQSNSGEGGEGGRT